MKLSVRKTIASCSFFLASCGLLGESMGSTPSFQLRREQRVAIATPAQLPEPARLAVEDLTSYLQRSLNAVIRRYPGLSSLSGLEEDVLFILSWEDAGNARTALLRKENIANSQLGVEGSLVKAAARNNKKLIFLVGKTVAGSCNAVYSFLENELGVGFFIDGDRVPTHDAVSIRDLDRREVPLVPIRGLFNHPTWKHPHANSCRLWSWDSWKESIDWMRRKRFNVFLLFHDEGGYLWGDVIFRAFPELKKNDTTLTQFVVDPAWRTELNHKIFQYARQSGLQIAYNLFYSQVPEFFVPFHMELDTHPLHMRNVGINATMPDCRKIMKQYWGKILETHGIDDSHIYIVCSYKHEEPLPSYYKSRNEVTMQAVELLRELDPQAKIYMETWCWKYLNEPETEMPRYQWLNENAPKEWKNFDEGIPKDIGVAEWDTKKDPERIPDPSFNGRPHIQVAHTMMEGWWPPSTLRRHPQWMLDYFGDSIDHGAEGVMFFHIQANTNMLHADLASQIGWTRPKLRTFYHDYARRRFGPAAANTLAESLGLFCDAVDMRAKTNKSGIRWSIEDLSLALTFPGFHQSAEEILARSESLGAAKSNWIHDKLKIIGAKAEVAARALLLARSVAPRPKDDPFYHQYCWELDYTAARFEGIQSLYRSHLLALSHPEKAQAEFDRALNAFFSVKTMFRDKPEYRMSALTKLEPGVPYTSAFLEDWESRGFFEDRAYTMHVVWDRMDQHEQFLRKLKPTK